MERPFTKIPFGTISKNDFYIQSIHRHTQTTRVLNLGRTSLKLMSLWLPWAVVFIAEGIGEDVNKAAGWGEITLWGRKKDPICRERRETRGDSEPINMHSRQIPSVIKKKKNVHLFFLNFLFNIDFLGFIYFWTACPLSYFQNARKAQKHIKQARGRFFIYLYIYIQDMRQDNGCETRHRGVSWDGWSIFQRAEGEWWQVRYAHEVWVSE